MAAAGAIRRRHLTDAGIQWLQVKPWICSIGRRAPRCIAALPVIRLHFYTKASAQLMASFNGFFWKALDPLHRAMHTVKYWSITMAIKMASKVGVFFIVGLLIVALAAAKAI